MSVSLVLAYGVLALFRLATGEPLDAHLVRDNFAEIFFPEALTMLLGRVSTGQRLVGGLLLVGLVGLTFGTGRLARWPRPRRPVLTWLASAVGLAALVLTPAHRHDNLTFFLRKPGASLDNNVCERALEKAILHRKNALFYKTEHGAHVGDLFMSLIHTCEFSRIDPFDYLTELQRNAEALASTAPKWMPWNYREALNDGRTPPVGAC